jgi:nucleoside-triphosphatase THEP1
VIKRTAFQIGDLTLGSEGWFIHGDKDRIILALLKIARYECDVEEIEKRLKGKGNIGRF